MEEKDENIEYKIETNVEEKIDPITKIKSFLVIMYFVISFVCCMIPKIGIISFGQFFLTIGIMAYKSLDKDRLVSIPFILVGAGCTIIPIINIIYTENIIKETFDIWFPIVMLIAMLIAGIIQLIIGLSTKKRKERNCTFRVLATISKYDEYYDTKDRRTMYTPIYTFTYDKKTYEVSQASYSSVEKYPIGNSIEILIDPANPNDFIMKGFAMYKLLIFMGVIFIISCTLALIYFIFNLVA